MPFEFSGRTLVRSMSTLEPLCQAKAFQLTARQHEANSLHSVRAHARFVDHVCCLKERPRWRHHHHDHQHNHNKTPHEIRRRQGQTRPRTRRFRGPFRTDSLLSLMVTSLKSPCIRSTLLVKTLHCRCLPEHRFAVFPASNVFILLFIEKLSLPTGERIRGPRAFLGFFLSLFPCAIPRTLSIKVKRTCPFSHSCDRLVVKVFSSSPRPWLFGSRQHRFLVGITSRVFREKK